GWRAPGPGWGLSTGGGGGAGPRQLFHGSGLHKRVDALMLASVPRTVEDDAIVDRLGMPVVVVGAQRPGWGSVRIDDVAAARTATEHLIGLGHRRIAHLAGDSRDKFASAVHVDRRGGHRGAPPPPRAPPRWGARPPGASTPH